MLLEIIKVKLNDVELEHVLFKGDKPVPEHGGCWGLIVCGCTK